MLEGLPPNSATHVMRLTCDEAMARMIADIIVETFDPPRRRLQLSRRRRARRTGIRGLGSSRSILAVHPTKPMCARSLPLRPGPKLRRRSCSIACGSAIGLPLPSKGLIRSGPPLCRSWRAWTRRGRANELSIEIEAALAFGTGHHGSTRGCLLMLDLIARSGAQVQSLILVRARASSPWRRQNC